MLGSIIIWSVSCLLSIRRWHDMFLDSWSSLQAADEAASGSYLTFKSYFPIKIYNDSIRCVKGCSWETDLDVLGLYQMRNDLRRYDSISLKCTAFDIDQSTLCKQHQRRSYGFTWETDFVFDREQLTAFAWKLVSEISTMRTVSVSNDFRIRIISFTERCLESCVYLYECLLSCSSLLCKIRFKLQSESHPQGQFVTFDSLQLHVLHQVTTGFPLK